MRPRFHRWLAEARSDPGLGRMIAVSGVVHLVVVGTVLFVAPRLRLPLESQEIAYTVELVDPNSLGGRLPVASESAPEPESVAEEPEVAPEPVPEPEPEAIPIPEPRAEPKPTARPKPTAPPKPKPTVPPKPKPTVRPKPEPSAAERAAAERDRRLREAIERVERRSGAGIQGGRDAEAGAALGSGGDGGGGGVLTGLDFILYKSQVEGTIRRNWTWVGSNPNLKVQVRFRIESDGEIQGLRLVASSGDRSYDESVLRAIRASSPLGPPPEKYRDVFSDYVIEFVSGDLAG